MRADKIEQASAVAEKIRKIIVRYNSTRLSRVRDDPGAMWDEVRRLTGVVRCKTYPENINAASLNNHYCAISTDPSYLAPNRKQLASRDDYTGLVSEFSVFNLLDKLSPTASGPDGLPFWFLKLAAPIICESLTHVINLSLATSIVPRQWKSAIIHPIPKIAQPVEPSQMRPISVVSILSRLTERLVIRNFINPEISTCFDLSNQYAYQATCSTTAALVSILSNITQLLLTNSHVHVLTFDYSKAFDTLSHSVVADTLSYLSASDEIYNWVLDYLSERSHATLFQGSMSSFATITAGVIQGSVLGPTLFNITSSTLTPFSTINKYFKYADDGYLIVPASNAHTIPHELLHHAAWASQRNLKLNISKTAEIVFARKRSSAPPPSPGIERVNSLKILGVLVDDHLTFQEHISQTIKSCSQSLFALRTMRQHGLDNKSLIQIFSSKILSKITYAVPAWWGFASNTSKLQLESFLRKAIKFNYYPENQLNIEQIVESIEYKLFQSIVNNPGHSLHLLLPSKKQVHYDLRKRGHDFSLPTRDTSNFIIRCLYKYV